MNPETRRGHQVKQTPIRKHKQISNNFGPFGTIQNMFFVWWIETIHDVEAYERMHMISKGITPSFPKYKLIWNLNICIIVRDAES